MTRFDEVQRFQQPWIWLAGAIPFGLLTWGLVQQLVFDRPWGNNPAPDWMLLLLWFVVGLGVPAFLLSLRLVTTVTQDGIDVRFRPAIGRRHIGFADIVSYTATTYRPLRDFGGWGVRWGGPRRWAFNVRGDRGVLIETADGKSILVGSQRAEELTAAIAANGGPPPTA